MIGSLYFIQEGPGGAIKIGWTSNCPHRRRDNLQIGNSHDLVLLGIIPDVPRTAEAEWHRLFEDTRKRSEWFYPTARLLRAIERQFPAPPRQTAPIEFQVSAAPCNLVSLAQWMKRHRVTQTKMAADFGIVPSTMSKYLAGKLNPSKLIALQIEQYTRGEVSAAEVLGIAGDAA